MNQAVVDIADLESVVLTANGKVVGYIDIVSKLFIGQDSNDRNTTYDFVGRAVNIQGHNIYRDFTNHGFACGMAIRTDDANEVANVENFNKALAEVSK